jgi:hypothetical protein
MRVLSIITLGAAMMLLCASLGGCASTGQPSGSANLARSRMTPPGCQGLACDPKFMGSARGGEGYIDQHQE